MRRLIPILLVVSSAFALPPDDAQKLYDRVSKSLVVVQYTMDGEAGRRELFGQGVIVGGEGLVMVSMAIMPTQIPDEQMKEFKVIIPGDGEREFEAELLGRDERTDLAFLRTKQKQDWPAIAFEDAPLRIAEPVVSVGLLPKEAGYRAYYAEASVSAMLRGPVPMCLVSTGGLTSIGSPVFNAQGKAVGFVGAQQGQNAWLNRSKDGRLALGAPARFFVPARDFILSLSDLPDGTPQRLPWLGAQLAGLPKEVASYFGLKEMAIAQVGEVIPNSPAAKAGLKPGDKIVKFNGAALERGDEAEELPAILMRNIRRLPVAEVIHLTVLRERGKPTIELSVSLEAQPKPIHQARRQQFDDLGMSMREVVFADTYAKKVAADTGGVVVSYVRQASSAATAGLRQGDLVTQLNKRPITHLDDFAGQYNAFRERNPKDLVVLVVIREQRTEVIKIEPPQ